MSRGDTPGPQPRTEPATADPVPWLDGLAGREGAGPDHDEGRQVRQSLLALQSVAMPPWSDIEQRAAKAAPDSAAPPRADANAGRTPAANAPRWRPAYGLAAALVLGVALTWLVRTPEPSAALRGGAVDAQAGAVWVVDQPAQAAERLAKDLLALGAQVEQSVQGAEVLLRVQAPAAAQQAVNQRLVALELALDGQGRLSLRVKAP